MFIVLILCYYVCVCVYICIYRSDICISTCIYICPHHAVLLCTFEQGVQPDTKNVVNTWFHCECNAFSIKTILTII